MKCCIMIFLTLFVYAEVMCERQFDGGNGYHKEFAISRRLCQKGNALSGKTILYV